MGSHRCRPPGIDLIPATGERRIGMGDGAGEDGLYGVRSAHSYDWKTDEHAYALLRVRIEFKYYYGLP